MKPILLQTSYLLAFILISTFAAAQPKATFSRGNTAYQQGNYQEAVEAYESLLADGHESVSLYHNLGNTYFRINKLGLAVLNYERALQIDPKDEECLHNLKVAKGQLKDLQVGIEKSGIVKIWLSIQQSLSSSAWNWIGIVLIWLGVGGLILWLVSQVRSQKKLGFLGGISLLLLSIIPFLLAHGRAQHQHNSNKAIIMVEETILKAAPETDSKTVLKLHEGTKVTIIDQIGSWNRVRLEDTSEGWLPKDVTEII